MNTEWLKDITIEDLPAQYHEMAEVIGVENVIKLATYYGGMPFYFTKIDVALQKQFRNKKILDELKDMAGSGKYKRLARKYNLTEVWVRQIERNGREEQL